MYPPVRVFLVELSVLLRGDFQQKLWAALLCSFALLIVIASLYKTFLRR